MTSRHERPAAGGPTDLRERGALTRYVVAATLARTSDGGAVVAVVLLVTRSGGSPATAGLLGACITAPHLLGQFLARRLDTARDGRRVIAAVCVVHALTLAAAPESTATRPETNGAGEAVGGDVPSLGAPLLMHSVAGNRGQPAADSAGEERSDQTGGA